MQALALCPCRGVYCWSKRIPTSNCETCTYTHTQSYFIPVCGVERVCGFGVDPLAIYLMSFTQQRLATTDGQLMAVSAILRYCIKYLIDIPAQSL